MEIITAEQAAEAAKGLTFEKVWASLMEMRISQAEAQEEMRKSQIEAQMEMRKSQIETQKSLDESQKRIEKNFDESQKRLNESLEESQKRIDRSFEESQKRIDKNFEESQKRIDKSLDDFQRNTEKSMSNLSKNLGRIGNSLGQLTEALFTAELWEKFSELGLPVTRQSKQVKFSDDKQVLTEVDLLIENGEYAILVEIKTDMHVSHIDEHLERIEIVRRYLDKLNDKRKLLGAVAGGVVAENVIKYAYRKGLYVVVQTGDAIAIADMPHGFKPREW